MKRLRKFYCYFVAAFACAALLGVSAYGAEITTLGEPRRISAQLFLSDRGQVYPWKYPHDDGFYYSDFRELPLVGLSDIVEVSGNRHYGAAIDAKGDLYAWGEPLVSGPIPQKVLSKVVSVSVSNSERTGAAVTEDGSLYVWGKLDAKDGKNKTSIFQTFDQPYQTDGFTDVAAVCSEMGEFSVILKNGDLYSGSLATFLSNTAQHQTAVKNGPLLTNVHSVSAGNYFKAALTKSGELYTWGENWDDALGQPSGSLSKPLMRNISVACAGIAGGGALSADGQTHLWGVVGKMREEPRTVYKTPAPLDTNGKIFVSMAMANGHNAGLTAEGELYVWYGNQPLKLLTKTDIFHDDSFNSDLSKLPVGYLASRRTIAPGFLVKENGDLYRWVMEDNRETRYLEKIEGISNVVDISAAYGHGSHLPVRIAAVTADGSLYTWGSGSSYEEEKPLLHPQSENIPVKSELTDVVSVHLGAYGGGAALTAQGEMYIWGSLYIGDDKKNNYQAVYRDIKTPEKVEGLSDLIDVSCDGATYAAVTRSGDLYLWGLETRMEGDYVILPNNTAKPHKIAENIRQVELTRGQSFAVTQDGRVYQWSADPAQMLLLDMPPVKSLSCGEMFYYAAVTQDGQLYMWGDSRTEYHDEEGNFSSHVPIPIEYEGKKTAQVSLGWGYTQVVDEEGKLYLSGRHASGSYVAPYHPGPDVDSRKTPLYHSSGVRVPGTVTGSMEKLQAGSGKVYQAGQFSDVDEGKWYGVQNQGTVRDAYQLGLMDGMGDGTFAPEGGLRVSEALKLACALRAAYTGDQIPAAAKGKSWYAPYVHYAVSNGMMEIGEFEDYAAYATRAQMAYLFAAALPEDCLTLSDQAALPGDVTDSHRYARQIRLLYQAGVLQGEDSSGAFHGDSGITRAQAAAIISRLAANGQSA